MQLFLQVAVLAVSAPFLNNLLHIIGYRRLKENFLFRNRVDKAQGFGMQRAAVADAKTVVYKLLVPGIDRTL